MKNSDMGPDLVRTVAGVPIPVRRDTGIEQIAAECLETVAKDKYDGDIPEFVGKTRMEVAVLSLGQDSATDPKARTEFLDRIMGKPKQKTEALVTTLNLNDYLLRLAEEDDAENRPVTVEVISDDDDEDEPATSFT